MWGCSTFVGGHEILGLVIAIVEAAGQNQVIVVSLEENSNVTPGRKKPATPPP